MRNQRLLQKLFVLVLLFVAIIVVSCSGSSDRQQTKATDSAGLVLEKTDRIDVYYFHNRMRCPSCVAIETVAQRTLEGLFAAELENEKLYFHILSIEEPDNRALAAKYQAYGPTLIVSARLNGLETITDLTGDGFRFAMRDEARFASVLKTTIEKSL